MGATWLLGLFSISDPSDQDTPAPFREIVVFAFDSTNSAADGQSIFRLPEGRFSLFLVFERDELPPDHRRRVRCIGTSMSQANFTHYPYFDSISTPRTRVTCMRGL